MDVLERLVLRLTDNGVAPDTNILTDCMESAKAAILSRRYPFGEYPSELEPRYEDLQFRICVDLYNQIGAEGETAHSENGVARTWDNSWISEQLLQEVTPKVGVTS